MKSLEIPSVEIAEVDRDEQWTFLVNDRSSTLNLLCLGVPCFSYYGWLKITLALTANIVTTVYVYQWITIQDFLFSSSLQFVDANLLNWNSNPSHESINFHGRLHWHLREVSLFFSWNFIDYFILFWSVWDKQQIQF